MHSCFWLTMQIATHSQPPHARASSQQCAALTEFTYHSHTIRACAPLWPPQMPGAMLPVPICMVNHGLPAGSWEQLKRDSGESQGSSGSSGSSWQHAQQTSQPSASPADAPQGGPPQSHTAASAEPSPQAPRSGAGAASMFSSRHHQSPESSARDFAQFTYAGPCII